jgi:hypothetical protein
VIENKFRDVLLICAQCTCDYAERTHAQGVMVRGCHFVMASQFRRGGVFSESPADTRLSRQWRVTDS